MPYLIDGHNLIPNLPGLSLSVVDDEMRLVEWLQVFCLKRRRTVDVFFDQAPPGFVAQRRFGMVKAHFVRQGGTADAAIMGRLVQLGKSARNYSVVSSDRQVQAAARQAHAQVIPSAEFAAEIIRLSHETSTTTPTEPALSKEEIAYWEDLFDGT